MPRSVNHVASRARRKNLMKLAKGYFGRRKNVWTVAKNAVENPNGTRLLKEIELIEISIVEEPADINATVSNIKSAIEKANSIREIEATLRDSAGLSRLEACAVVSRIKSVIQSDFDNGKKEAQEIAQLFKSFNKV